MGVDYSLLQGYSSVGRCTRTDKLGLFFFFDAQEVEIFTNKRYSTIRPIDRVMWDYYPLKQLAWDDSIVKAITHSNHSIAVLLGVKEKTNKQTSTRVQGLRTSCHLGSVVTFAYEKFAYTARACAQRGAA
ncbi:hypothetical protein EVAR_96865_1 [Eumeta japonica]|uniref:Uncharacterized protein n=1 Tax=Eumeta variegata TaxID=151549 RepID=A0A4C1WK46_EUMVA|nr:hypothetical protein EVAR_96865_1 [Eumeta japonica]